MYHNTGYLHDFEEDTSYEQEEGLVVCSCGHYRLLQLKRMETIRPEGRHDWQILYMAGGSGHFLIDNEIQILPAGTVILYPPAIQQHYYYLLKDNPEVYWLHLSGQMAEPILNQVHLTTDQIHWAGDLSSCLPIFDEIIEELQMKSPEYQTLCGALAVELIARISREIFHQKTSRTNEKDQLLRIILQDINQNYRTPLSMEEYARKYSMSLCWFIRKFKDYTGVPPQKYITMLRINQARELLDNSSLNMTEIASLIGYENPLYFSRLFRKFTGTSPSDYRMRFHLDRD